MNKQKANELALAYQGGNERALDELFRMINPFIEKASAEVEPYVEDFTKFDCRVIRNLKRVIETFDPEKHDFLSAAKSIIRQDKARFIRRNSRKSDQHVMMSVLEPASEEDLGYQFEDPVANTEEDVLFKERVALLAQGDPKKEMILSQWSKGADDRSISELLAQRFGGKAETHRKFITRYKKACQNRLAPELT